MGCRRGSHGDGTWSVPGGHLEFGESLEACATREVYEETGVAIHRVRFGGITSDVFWEDGKHYITIWMLSRWAKNDPCVNEPETFTDLTWRSFDNLPEPLFLPWRQLIDSPFMAAVKSASIDHC